jgi:hypothetical protein
MPVPSQPTQKQQDLMELGKRMAAVRRASDSIDRAVRRLNPVPGFMESERLKLLNMRVDILIMAQDIEQRARKLIDPPQEKEDVPF